MGSPLKKQRASLQGAKDDISHRLGLGLSGVRADVLGAIEQTDGGGSVDHDVGPVAQDRMSFGSLLNVPEPPKVEASKVKTEQMEDEEL